MVARRLGVIRIVRRRGIRLRDGRLRDRRGRGGLQCEQLFLAGRRRRASASEDQRLRDSIRRYADALRRFESTVVSEVTQEESVTGTVEVVRNPNYGHSLTVIYHQILRHLRVDTEIAGVRECLFVPFAIRPFTLERAYRWREAIEQYLRDRSYAPALRYLKDVLTGFANSSVPPGRRSDLPVRNVYGSIYLTLGIERPADTTGRPVLRSGMAAAPALPGAPARGIFSRLKEQVAAQRDKVFQEQYAPRAAAKWVNTLQIEADGQILQADFTLATRYQFNGVVRVDFTAPVPDGQLVTRETLRSIVVRATAGLPAGSTANVTRVTFNYQTDQFERSVSASQGVGDLVLPETGEPDTATISTIPTSWERQNLRAEMILAVQDLLRHLNEHMEYYQKAILWCMDRDRLLILLDGFYVPRTNGVSIASVVERDPVAIMGNCLVYRVSAGSFLGLDNIKTPQELVNFYIGAEPPRSPMLVSLPTDGLYAQAIMDECEALEPHFGNTDWVLNEPDPALGDLPPELLQSRRADATAATTPTQLPATIINLQNAPDAPAPSGLQGILGAVSNANAFRDMAGLAGTQANARAAMEAAANLATNFGNQAAALKMADIAAKAQATQTADQKLASIQRAKEMNLISADEAAKQAGEVLKGMHSSSPTTPPHENPAVNSAIQAAGRTSGSVVEAATSDGQVRVEMGKGQDVGPTGETPPAAEGDEEKDEPPVPVPGLWFDDHGSEFGTDENFDTRNPTGALLAFNEDEHFDLGENLQRMIDQWAIIGLIHGGCMINTKSASTGTGLSAPIDQWDIFTPDPAQPTDPYHAMPTIGSAHWHYVTPDPVFADPSTSTRWTPATLSAALKQGKAAALSVGQIVMMSGDFLGSFNDLKNPAGQSRWSGGASVHIMAGFDQKDPLAYTLFDVETFPPDGHWRDLWSDDLAKLHRLERAREDASAVSQEIASGHWKRVEALVRFLRAARGTTPFSELHLMAHSLFAPTRTGRFNLALVRDMAPWLPGSATQQLQSALSGSEFQQLNANGFPERFFKIVVTNGYYAELASQNLPHFAPDNWSRFEQEHRQALDLLAQHVTSAGGPNVTAPIPADAVARTAYSLHYLTDAFSAGTHAGAQECHGRGRKHGLEADARPRRPLRSSGSERTRRCLARVRGRLPASGRAATHGRPGRILAKIAKVNRQGIDVDPDANYRHAVAAVGAAFKQLHYEAQRPPRRSGRCAVQAGPQQVPPDDGSDRRRLQPRRAGGRRLRGLAHHRHSDEDQVHGQAPAAAPADGNHRAGEPSSALRQIRSGGNQGYVWRTDDVGSLGHNRILRMKWHGIQVELDFTDLFQFARITDGMGGWVQGGETWLPKMLSQMKEVT